MKEKACTMLKILGIVRFNSRAKLRKLPSNIKNVTLSFFINFSRLNCSTDVDEVIMDIYG